MSIKSFLTKLWGAIKSLFNSFPDKLKAAVHIGIIITENIKTIIDSPIADILTAIIPGEIDDKIKQALRAGIPVILTDLKLTDQCSGLTDPQEITKCAVKTLKTLDGDIKSAFLHNLSILIAQVAADGKLSWADGVCILEWYYQNKFKTTSN
ncbi:MAG: hypothetical protein WC615_10120 [Mucilaginibacter sp.]|jgi:hypothetical protein|uniref:hypothetical protein n=1 Tax=Mucilaginibacter sp. TaxID=1882438 RepID=UPI003567F2EE